MGHVPCMLAETVAFLSAGRLFSLQQRRRHRPTSQRRIGHDMKSECIECLDHARLWCPELDRVPERLIHAPWQLTPAQQEAAAFRLGREYPRPLVDLDASVAANRRRWEESESG